MRLRFWCKPKKKAKRRSKAILDDYDLAMHEKAMELEKKRSCQEYVV